MLIRELKARRGGEQHCATAVVALYTLIEPTIGRREVPDSLIGYTDTGKR